MKLHRNKERAIETLPSPLTGKPVEFKIRAFCASCGCLISHKSVEAVRSALDEWQSCRKCGCLEAAVKFTLEEEFFGGGEAG